MILIADSGSTKTDWVLIANKNQQRFNTMGFHPFFITHDIIKQELDTAGISDYKDKIDIIYFYGTGCSTLERTNKIKDGLYKVFKQAKINVFHDMLGAARASCKNNKGMVGILGTGSNSCVYDGRNITANIMSLGYILGDEGSGAFIGKTFIQHYLNNELPTTLTEQFKMDCVLSPVDIIDMVYNQPQPNRFLASFCPFIKINENDNFIKEMLNKCFNAYFDKQICKYEQYQSLPLSLVGSIAFEFEEHIKRVANNRDVKIKTVLKNPIDNLIEFHQ